MGWGEKGEMGQEGGNYDYFVQWVVLYEGVLYEEITGNITHMACMVAIGVWNDWHWN